ncbi:hypothetical protein AAC387_Pa02g3591 [Persea americana]
MNPRLARILEKVAVQKELIVVLANSNVEEMLEIWLGSIQRVGLPNSLVVALDNETENFCNQRKFMRTDETLMKELIPLGGLNPFDHLFRDSDVESMTDGHNMTVYGQIHGIKQYSIFFPSHPGYYGLHASRRTMDYYLFMNSKVLFKTVRKDADLSKFIPVIIHVNYHPDKLPKLKAIVEYFVDGNQDALDPFPDGSKW